LSVNIWLRHSEGILFFCDDIRSLPWLVKRPAFTHQQPRLVIIELGSYALTDDEARILW